MKTRLILKAILEQLEVMPEMLEGAFGGLAEQASLRPGPGGSFSPVEHCWHLADLEREGYAQRIRRLLDEDEPQLPDFDGARIAAERNYRQLSLAEGIATFRTARRDNLRMLRTLTESQWARSGTQEGVGRVTLADIPRMMAEHDASHRREVDAWIQQISTI